MFHQHLLADISNSYKSESFLIIARFHTFFKVLDTKDNFCDDELTGDETGRTLKISPQRFQIREIFIIFPFFVCRLFDDLPTFLREKVTISSHRTLPYARSEYYDILLKRPVAKTLPIHYEKIY